MIGRNQYLSKLLSAKNNDFSKFFTDVNKCYEIDFIAQNDSFQQIDNLRSLDSNDFIIITIANFLLRFIKYTKKARHV